MMKRSMMSLVLIGSLAGAPLLVGCDREVAHTEKTTTSSDGTVKKESATVKEHPDGTVTTDHKKTVDKD